MTDKTVTTEQTTTTSSEADQSATTTTETTAAQDQSKQEASQTTQEHSSSALAQGIKPTETKEDDTKTEEDKSKAEDSTSTEEGIELEITEDSPLSDEDIQELEGIISSSNMGKDEAQKLISRVEAAYKRANTEAEEKFNNEVNTMHKEFMSDPMFLGKTGEENFAKIGKVLRTFGDESMQALATQRGVGDNLTFAKFLVRIGNALDGAGGVIVGGDAAVPKVEAQKSLEEQMYPEYFKK